MIRYILFKPLADIFKAQTGHYEVALEVLWQGKKTWVSYTDAIPYDLSDAAVLSWNDPDANAIQVTSSTISDMQYE